MNYINTIFVFLIGRSAVHVSSIRTFDNRHSILRQIAQLVDTDHGLAQIKYYVFFKLMQTYNAKLLKFVACYVSNTVGLNWYI